MDDRSAKEIMQAWQNPRLILGTPYLLARPGKLGPDMYVPGARMFTSNPDGMYCHLHTDEDGDIEYSDVIAIEVTQTRNNLYDKRSRYSANDSSALYCPEAWLKKNNDIINTRWLEVQNIPIRFRSVVFVLPKTLYFDWKKHMVPWPHEYFLEDSQLEKMNSDSSVWEKLTPNSHYLASY
ncbi:MAG: hypothetical protein ACK4UO_03705 [Pseudolabrys sp.]